MAWNRIAITTMFVLIVTCAVAEVNRYMVFFSDKAGSEFSTALPGQYLSEKAIQRRIRQGILVTEDDLPVNESYVQEVRDAGVEVYFKTRWMNAVLVQCDDSKIAAIQSLPFVKRVEFVAPMAKLLSSGRRKTNQKSNGAKGAAKTAAQLHLIGLDQMQAAGYKGENICIGIFDSGFQGVNVTAPFQNIFVESRIDLEASKDFVYNSPDVFQYDDHGAEVFSVIAAYQEGVFTGGSYKANYQLYVTEDVSTEYRVEEYNWLFAAERADSAGVDIINSSLGYYNFDDETMDYLKSAMDGKTTVVSRAAQMAANRGVIVVCSAGNEGGLSWQIITAPADAKDVLAIANVDSEGRRTGSSSIGPSADGRIKPDVAAMGVNTSIVKPDGSLGFATGTSLSSPLVTSLAAGLWQRYPALTNVVLMDAIRKSASQAGSPDKFLGYGIPNFAAVVNYLEQSEQENIFEIYPNPVVADTFTIRPFDPNQVAACRVELLSSQGQVVRSTNVTFSWLNRSFTADLTSYAAGIYFVRVYWGEKRYVFRMVKT